MQPAAFAVAHVHKAFRDQNKKQLELGTAIMENLAAQNEATTKEQLQHLNSGLISSYRLQIIYKL